MAGEGKLQAYMKRRCAENGILWRKIKFEGVRGAPDTLIGFNGTAMFVELKNTNGRGRVSEQQKRRIRELNAVGLFACVAETKEEVDGIINKITGRQTP